MSLDSNVYRVLLGRMPIGIMSRVNELSSKQQGQVDENTTAQFANECLMLDAAYMSQLSLVARVAKAMQTNQNESTSASPEVLPFLLAAGAGYAGALIAKRFEGTAQLELAPDVVAAHPMAEIARSSAAMPEGTGGDTLEIAAGAYDKFFSGCIKLPFDNWRGMPLRSQPESTSQVAEPEFIPIAAGLLIGGSIGWGKWIGPRFS